MSNTTINQNIAAIFKATRKFHRLQQKEISTILGVTQGTISKIEAGLMHPELNFWFKFLQTFHITDPYCFTYGGVEFSEDVFQTLQTKGSSLASQIDFSKEQFVFNIRQIRPLFDFILKNHRKAFEEFLKENHIGIEIFYILNHPVTSDLADLFFSFLHDRKINEKSVALLNLNFAPVLGKAASSPELVSSFINEDKNGLVEYEMKKDERKYFVTLNKERAPLIKPLKSAELILNYNLLYPYHILKFSQNLSASSPVITEIKKDSKWQIEYAA